MAKKKKSSKKPKPPPNPILQEIQKFTVEQVDAKKEEMLVKLKEIRRNRNYYMLERDAIQQYYYIVCQENEELRNKVKNVESEMEAKQRNHRDEIQIYLQKVTHLEYEHGHNLGMVEKTKAKDLQEEAEIYQKKKEELLKEKEDVEATFDREERDYEAMIKRKKEANREALEALRSAHDEEHERLRKKYNARLQDLIADLELRRKIEIHEVEERKNSHINQLIENHERSFNEMRDYYNGLTRDNLGLIKSLKDELASLKTKQAQHEATIADYTARNKELRHLKEDAEQEVTKLKEKLKNYQKDKTSLKHSRGRAGVLEEILKKLNREQKDLSERYKKSRKECEKLVKTFQEVVGSVQKKGEAGNEKLRSHLDGLIKQYHDRKEQFNAITRASHMDPVAIQEMTARLHDDLSEKSTKLKNLRYENARIEKAHDDLIRVYEAKIAKFGIPDKERKARDLHNINGSTRPANLLV